MVGKREKEEKLYKKKDEKGKWTALKHPYKMINETALK